MVTCSETELLQFPKFQLRLMEKGAGFADHPAISGLPAVKKQWNDEVAIAVKAGQTVDVDKCDFKFVGDLN